MRAIKLHPDDCELFNHNLDGEKHAFFRSHLPAFKRMWSEEGRTYWLRFLITFKMHFEANPYNRNGGDKLLNFIFIFIHKQFVEGSYSVAKNFIDNIFIAAKHFHNLPEQSFTKNPFYTKESREAFRALLGKPDLDDDIPVPVMGFVCSVYFEFTSAVCALLKKWLQEPDLSEESVKKIDYTLFYWRPCGDWEEPNFMVGCFEKYLASFWKDELPKMLLTCDIHNIFSNHTIESCCDYEKEMNVFDLLKDKSAPSSPFCMPHVKILTPSVVSCGAHNNCHLKILHDDKCLEPYLCEGEQPCIVTCEVTSKRQNQSKDANQANPWKKLIVETFASKDANRRTVSTLAESEGVQIETYLHDKDSDRCEVKDCAESMAGEFLCMHDAELRNSFNQHKRKEQLKKRLRKKLNKKYYFDPKDYEDSDYCWALYEQAQQAWICDMCEGNFKDVVHTKHNDIETRHASSFACVRRALTSVAVGTGDIVIGRVVNPSASLPPQSNVNCSESHEKGDVKTKSKKSKSKKKKGNVNGSSNNKSPTDSVTKNLESKPGNTMLPQVSEINVKVKSDTTSTIGKSESECSAKATGLNGNKSNCLVNKANTKANELSFTTAIKTESSEVVTTNRSSSSNVLNSDKDSLKPVSNFDSTNKCVDKEIVTNIAVVRDESVKNTSVNNILDTKTTDITSQSLNEVFKETLNPITDTLNEGDNSATNMFSVDNIPSLDNTVDKFLKSVGITDECSPQKVSKSDILIKNEALEIADNEIPEILNNADSPVADKAVDEFLTLIGVLKKPVETFTECDSGTQEPINNLSDQVESTDKKVKLKTCAFCLKKEVQVKTFKRCARCKIEKFAQQRYYCSRSCQLEDWEESHRDEHSRKAEPIL